MLLLRRAVIHMVYRLVASQLGCHTVPEPDDIKGFTFSRQPAFPIPPTLVNGSTVIEARNPARGCLLGTPLSLTSFFSLASNCLWLLTLHDVSRIHFMFPYSHQQRVNLYFYYSLLGSFQYPLCPLCITPEHPLLQYFQSCVYKIKIRAGQFHDKAPWHFYVLCGISMFFWELSSNSSAGHLCSCSRRNDNTRGDPSKVGFIN